MIWIASKLPTLALLLVTDNKDLSNLGSICKGRQAFGHFTNLFFISHDCYWTNIFMSFFWGGGEGRGWLLLKLMAELNTDLVESCMTWAKITACLKHSSYPYVRLAFLSCRLQRKGKEREEKKTGNERGKEKGEEKGKKKGERKE